MTTGPALPSPRRHRRVSPLQGARLEWPPRPRPGLSQPHGEPQEGPEYVAQAAPAGTLLWDHRAHQDAGRASIMGTHKHNSTSTRNKSNISQHQQYSIMHIRISALIRGPRHASSASSGADYMHARTLYILTTLHTVYAYEKSAGGQKAKTDCSRCQSPVVWVCIHDRTAVRVSKVDDRIV